MNAKNLSRRRFLELVGAAGGATAVYQTSMALGLMQETGAPANLDLLNVSRAKKTVVLLGAGISTLNIAYELERAGYDCRIIEASHRIGGRVLTLRSGDMVDELGNKQICRFDDEPHLYFNAGAARIPGHHQRALHYCKVLGVELEIMANDNRRAYTQEPDAFGGRPIQKREYMADARGFMSELVYKAVDKNAFDQPMSNEDRERMLQFAISFGDLDPNGLYKGSNRAGYATGGFRKAGELKGTLNFSEILNSNFWRYGMHFAETEDWAAPLMTPVGGMDNVVKAFLRKLRTPITLNAQVQSIMLRDKGVDIVYNHKGKQHMITADYCFNSIPAHFIAGIHNNFPKDYAAGLASLSRGHLSKIGLQMSKRFWEDEEIYGGITSTSQEIGEIWYPSHGIFKQKGIVLGAYLFGFSRRTRAPSNFFEKMTPEERIRFAGEQGNNIHKGYSSYIENGVSIPWGRMNHMMGCGSGWTDEVRAQYFSRLQNPEGRHYMIGDQISYHSSWQEGAFASAEFALQDLDKRVRAEMAAMTGAS
ncbi:MAG: FAD-dependent oxidoreductase [Gammaproteobacteria bacterium]|nr:FAD-dependent oxidoreductase [Gammaproteobacteria bacterium]